MLCTPPTHAAGTSPSSLWSQQALNRQLVNLRIASHPRHFAPGFKAQDWSCALSAKTCVSVCRVLPYDVISVQGSPFPLSLLLSPNGSAADSFPERIAPPDLCYVLVGFSGVKTWNKDLGASKLLKKSSRSLQWGSREYNTGKQGKPSNNVPLGDSPQAGFSPVGSGGQVSLKSVLTRCQEAGLLWSHTCRECKLSAFGSCWQDYSVL